MFFRIQNGKRLLSRRLAGVYALITSLVLLFISLIIFYVCQHFLFSRQAESVETLSDLVCAHILEQWHGGESLRQREMLEEFNTVNGELNIYLHDSQETLINQAVNFYLDPASLSFSDSPRFSLHSGTLLFYDTQDIQEGAVELGRLTLVLSMNSEYDFLRMLSFLLLATILIGSAVALIAGFHASRRMLSPIDRLIEDADCIDTRNLSARLSIPKTEDEFSGLALKLNSMLDRIEEGFRQQGRFVADASHELRTPLSILQGNADLISRWGHSDPQILTGSLDTIRRQIAYMNKLVENLLFLARADEHNASIEKTSIEIKPFFEALLEERQILDEHHQYKSCCPEGLFVAADPDMIFQLFSILLDNSIKYTPSGGAITLGAEAGKETLLYVQDTGIGIPSQHLPHIFSRFYRVDKARSRSTGGWGLGLSIAQAIMFSHGGSIEAQSAPERGTKILLHFPIS